MSHMWKKAWSNNFLSHAEEHNNRWGSERIEMELRNAQPDERAPNAAKAKGRNRSQDLSPNCSYKWNINMQKKCSGSQWYTKTKTPQSILKGVVVQCARTMLPRNCVWECGSTSLTPVRLPPSNYTPWKEHSTPRKPTKVTSLPTPIFQVLSWCYVRFRERKVDETLQIILQTPTSYTSLLAVCVWSCRCQNTLSLVWH